MFEGWWIVRTHFMVQLFVTGFFTYSLPLLFPIVIQEFSADATGVNALLTGASVIGIITGPVAGPLVDRWSAKGLMLVGTMCLVLGLLGLSISQTIGQFAIVGALSFGIANVLLGPLTGSAVISRWFTAKRGRALGIAAIGTSVGGMLLPKILGRTIESVGWRPGLQGVALAVVVITLPLLIFRFWNTPSERGAEPDGPVRSAADASDTSVVAGAAAAPRPVELETNRGILMRPAFWLFSSSLGLFLATYSAALANIGQFYADLGLPSADAPNLMLVLSICGIAGKLGFGYLADRMPLKLGLMAAIAATGGSFLLFLAEPGYSMMLGAAALMGFATGGILPVWNAMVPAIFGVENFGRAMGWMSPVISVLVTPSFVLIGMIRDSTGSYLPAFEGFLGVLVVAILLLLPLEVGARRGPQASGAA